MNPTRVAAPIAPFALRSVRAILENNFKPAAQPPTPRLSSVVECAAA